MPITLRTTLLFTLGIVAGGLVVAPWHSVVASQLTVRVDRWLEVRQLSGAVTLRHGSTTQTAQIGSRLQAVGDALTTGNDASAVLVVDTNIGFINVSENTTVQIQQLETTPSGGKITKLVVSGGQVRLQLRPFTNPDSELDIQTPAGVSGVRGTTFGVTVRPDGTTGIATLEGQVTAEAQKQVVWVGAGLQSLIVPGEPPTPPQPLQDEPQLDIRLLTATDDQVRIGGHIDPVNLLEIEDQPQVVDRDGQFDLQLPPSPSSPPGRRELNVTVITPLGTRKNYRLLIP